MITHNPRLNCCTVACMAFALSSFLPIATAQNARLVTKRVNVVNTSEKPVEIWSVESKTGKGKKESALSIGQEASLQVGAEVTKLQVKEGNGKESNVLAEIELTSAPSQVLDVGSLIRWQSMVSVTIENDSQSPIEVFWIDGSGIAQSQVKQLNPDQEFSVSTYPGGTWRLGQGEETVGEFIIGIEAEQRFSVEELSNRFSKAMTMVVQNTLDRSISIHWLHPDGSEVEFLPELTPGYQTSMQVLDGQIWTFRSGGELKGAYRANDRGWQQIDLQDLVVKTERALAALTQESPTTSSPTNDVKSNDVTSSMTKPSESKPKDAKENTLPQVSKQKGTKQPPKPPKPK